MLMVYVHLQGCGVKAVYNGYNGYFYAGMALMLRHLAMRECREYMHTYMHGFKSQQSTLRRGITCYQNRWNLGVVAIANVIWERMGDNLFNFPPLREVRGEWPHG